MTSQAISETRPSTGIPAEASKIDVRAQSTYRDLKNKGFSDADIMAFAGELLSLVATDVRSATAAE